MNVSPPSLTFFVLLGANIFLRVARKGKGEICLFFTPSPLVHNAMSRFFLLLVCTLFLIAVCKTAAFETAKDHARSGSKSDANKNKSAKKQAPKQSTKQADKVQLEEEEATDEVSLLCLSVLIAGVRRTSHDAYFLSGFHCIRRKPRFRCKIFTGFSLSTLPALKI